MINKLKIPKKYIGVPFLENGKDFKGADCIHLAQLFVENELGIKVTHMPTDIKEALKKTNRYVELLEPILFNELIPGDIPFFAFPGERWHCGIYVGYGQILHTVRPVLADKKTTSMVTPILDKWRQYYIGAIRTKGKTEITVPDAGWAVAAIIISVVTTIYSVVAALTAPQPKAGSNAYTFDALDNTVSNQIIYPIIFGRKKYGGNIIWYKNSGSITYRIIVLGIGPWNSISDVRLNDIPIADCPGCSYTAYLGTPDQVVDSRASGEVYGLRNIVYLALTIQSSDKIPGGNPTVTCVGETLLMKTWDGTSWSGQNYSANPAACLRHLLIMPREDGGAGVDEDEIDDASFGEVYDYCAALIDDGEGSTHARHQFDYIFNEQKPIQQAIKEMLQPYGMYFASGEKITLKILKQDDSVYDFTMDNIDVDTFEHWEIDINESYNDVHVQYSDPDQNDAAIDVPAINQVDQVLNGIRQSPDFSFLGISRFAEAARRAEFIKNESCINIAMCSFTVDIDALHVSKGSVVTVTHDEPAWVAKLFRVVNIEEADNFKCALTLKEENPSIYNDAMGSVIASYTYGAPPNPYAPVTDITNLVISEGAYYLHKDGKVGSDINISWTAPTDSTRRLLKEYIVELKKAAGNYEEVGRTTGTTITIYGVEDEVTYSVKVKTISVNNIVSDGVISADLTVLGKLNPPSDVTGFEVSQEGNFLRFSWTAITDPDFARYVIRKGSEWNTGQVIAEKTDTTEFMYPVGEVGSVTFMIKAVDNSGNESLIPGLDTIVITPPPEMNFINNFDLWIQNLIYILNNLELVYTNDYALGYVRQALCLKTTNTWESREAESKTWEQQEADGGLVLNGTVESTGYYEMVTPIDLGTIFEAKVVIDADYRNVAGGSLEVQISYSEDGVAYSSFVTVNAATTYLGRYVKFKFILSTTDTSQQIYFYGCRIYINAPVTKTAWFRDIAVPTTGKTILFGVNFSSPPRVSVTVVNGVIGFPIVNNKTADQCDVFVYDKNGAAIGTAEIDCDVKGY